jgi:hypothetical protein
MNNPNIAALEQLRPKTEAGICLQMLYMAIVASEMSYFFDAAAGDEPALKQVEGMLALAGIDQEGSQVLVAAVANALDEAGGVRSSVNAVAVLGFLLPELRRRFFPDVDVATIAQALGNSRQLEYYLVRRVSGDPEQEPQEEHARDLYAWSMSCPLPSGPKGSIDELAWVKEQICSYIESRLRVHKSSAH